MGRIMSPTKWEVGIPLHPSPLNLTLQPHLEIRSLQIHSRLNEVTREGPNPVTAVLTWKGETCHRDRRRWREDDVKRQGDGRLRARERGRSRSSLLVSAQRSSPGTERGGFCDRSHSVHATQSWPSWQLTPRPVRQRVRNFKMHQPWSSGSPSPCSRLLSSRASARPSTCSEASHSFPFAFCACGSDVLPLRPRICELCSCLLSVRWWGLKGLTMEGRGRATEGGGMSSWAWPRRWVRRAQRGWIRTALSSGTFSCDRRGRGGCP